MLEALMDGRAWTGRELASFAHVTPSTTSEHLQRLVNGALIAVVPQGRHRYYRIASPEVAHALETLTFLAELAPARRATTYAADAEVRRARTCYDHLAGELGVAVCDALVRRSAVLFGPPGGSLTAAGVTLFDELGIDSDGGKGRRTLCRPCLDWSERRFHLAGYTGAALARHALAKEWIRRKTATRAVEVTAVGIEALRDAFGVQWRP
jgi:hypothetical protein